MAHQRSLHGPARKAKKDAPPSATAAPHRTRECARLAFCVCNPLAWSEIAFVSITAFKRDHTSSSQAIYGPLCMWFRETRGGREAKKKKWHLFAQVLS